MLRTQGFLGLAFDTTGTLIEQLKMFPKNCSFLNCSPTTTGIRTTAATRTTNNLTCSCFPSPFLSQNDFDTNCSFMKSIQILFFIHLDFFPWRAFRLRMRVFFVQLSLFYDVTVSCERAPMILMLTKRLGEVAESSKALPFPPFRKHVLGQFAIFRASNLKREKN